jgi:hypothetical protein
MRAATRSGVGMLTIVGGGLVLLGSFLDWYSLGPAGLSAWDIPILYLLSGDADGNDLKAGVILAVAVGALCLPLIMRSPSTGRPLAVGSGAVCGTVVGLAVYRLASESPQPDAGIGLILSGAGAALVLVESLGVLNLGVPR